MKAEAPDDESLRSILGVVASAWRVRLLDTRWLPDIAAELIAAGLDSPSLIELAGLDFAPFDPRDASDLLVAALEEVELPMPDTDHALITATQLVAWALETGRLLPRYATQWAARAYLAADYTGAPPALVKLFTLDDEYDAAQYAYWHRSAKEIDEDVRTVVRELCACSDVTPWTTDPCATRIAGLILPGQ